MDFTTLLAFRVGLYACFKQAGDALMNASDALLTGSSKDTFIQLSQSPFFQRRWPSLYESFQDGKIDHKVLVTLLISFAPPPTPQRRFILALDCSKVERPESVTARDRTYVHLDNLPECKAPVAPGWTFSTVVVTPQKNSSWTYVLDNQRVTSDQTPANVAAEQLKAIVPQLNERFSGQLPGGRILLTADSGYGTATFLEQTKKIECDMLLRMKSNRKLYRAAPAPVPHKRGPHHKDGPVFRCKDACTHGEPDDTWTGMDEKGKVIEIACWEKLHFKECRDTPVCVIRIIRHGANQTKRDPRTSWFIWKGEGPPCLGSVVEEYKSRFSIEHGYRFEKQDLHWCKPHLRTPEQFEIWTLLMSVVHDELGIARNLAEAQRLPWESPGRELTPAQVRRGMGQILVHVGTPACPCKSRGLSAPGREKGAIVKRAERYPVIKKMKETKKKAA